MRRVVSAILGINTIVISGRKYNLVRYDKNLQFVHIQLTEEINYNDYNMVVKYRMPNGNVLADILEMETNEFDIQIPNEVVQLSGELAIEFTLSGKENDDSLTSLGRIKLTIQDALESNIDQEEIRVLPTVANVLSRITECTKDGITEIEKSKDEAIEELKKHSDSNVEESKEQVNIFTSQKQEQLDTYTKTKESQLDEYTTTKNMGLDSHTIEKKKELDNYVESSVKPQVETYIYQKADPIITAQTEVKKQELNQHVETINKPELDEYTKAKEVELDTYTGKKKSELDAYEKAKEGQLDSHTNTKKEELNTHEKAKEKELDNYVTTVNKPELDKHTNIKKEELNSHTKTKESEITQVTETKKQEITAHGSNELDKFNQGAKQEADEQIGRVVAEGDVQVQRVKDESEGVIPRIEELESGKVSKSGDTMTGPLIIESSVGNHIILKRSGELKGSLTSNVDGIALYNEKSGKMLELKDNGDIQPESPIKFINSNIAMLVGTYIKGISDINEFFLEKPFGFNFGTTNDATKYKNMFPYDNNANAIVNFNTFNEDYCHQFGLSSNGEIYHRSKSLVYGIKDWVRMANENDINKLKNEIGTKINELNSKKSDLTGSTFTGLVAVKKDTNGEAMVALNSAYGNGDIYSGGSAKGVGFKNRTSGKGIFFGDDGSVKLEAINLEGDIKNVIEAINNQQLPHRYIPSPEDLNNVLKPGSYSYGPSSPNKPSNYGQLLCFVSDGKKQDNLKNWLTQIALSTESEIFFRQKINDSDFTDWVKLHHTGNFNPSTKLDKSSVVNDIVSGGTDKVLSAEQGKVLKQEIDNLTNEIEQLKQQIAEMQK